jgi:hypothetical protein
MATTSDERQLNLAIQAMKRDPKLSARASAELYTVSHATLSRRIQGTPSRRDSTPKSRKLTNLEEETIVQYILDLDARAFPPRLCGVEDMANRLLTERNTPHVGKRWASNFIKRQPELQTRFFRRYDY